MPAHRLTEVERLHFVIETQRLVNATTLETDGVMKVVTERAQSVTEADGGVVELAEGNEMVYRAVSGSAVGFLGLRLSMGSSLSGACVRQGIPLLCQDTETDPRVDGPACLRVGLRSMIVVPLMHHGNAVGVLKVMSGERDDFDSADMSLLELMGGFIATSLSHSFSYEFEAHKALHDPLTGLPNRALLMDRLEHEIYDARRYGGTFGVFYLDLNGFKAINDIQGHEFGDRVLQALAAELQDSLRKGDTLARLGGDEFVLLCPHGNDRSEQRIRKRIHAVIESITQANGLSPESFGVSVGVIWSTGSEHSPAEVLREADAAMYAAKRTQQEAASA